MQKNESLLYYECEESQFHRDYQRHLEGTLGLALILSPFLYDFAMDRYIDIFKALIIRGRRVCVFTQEPKAWRKRDDSNLADHLQKECRDFTENVKALRAAGVHVTIRHKVHIKANIVDEMILWFGTMNSLSHTRNEESMNCFYSRSHVARMIARYRLDTCEECAASPEYALFKSKRPSVADRIKILWDTLWRRRSQLGLKQADVARRSGVSSGYLSLLLAGKRDCRLEVFLNICNALDCEVVAVPRCLVPAITELMSGFHDPADALSPDGNSIVMLADPQEQFGDHEILHFDMTEIRKKL